MTGGRGRKGAWDSLFLGLKADKRKRKERTEKPTRKQYTDRILSLGSIAACGYAGVPRAAGNPSASSTPQQRSSANAALKATNSWPAAAADRDPPRTKW